MSSTSKSLAQLASQVVESVGSDFKDDLTMTGFCNHLLNEVLHGGQASGLWEFPPNGSVAVKSTYHNEDACRYSFEAKIVCHGQSAWITADVEITGADEFESRFMLLAELHRPADTRTWLGAVVKSETEEWNASEVAYALAAKAGNWLTH